MNRKYQHFKGMGVPLLELIALIMAGSLSIAILYQVFVNSHSNYTPQPGNTLSWISLIR